MPSAPVHGATLAYDRAGTEGDPTVLIHGSLVDRSSWDRVMPVLAQNLQVLRYDRRGYGESTPGPREPAVRTDSDDLAGLLAETDFYPAHLIAHSYGGAVAFRFAIDHPEMVRSLSVHEPPFFGVLVDRPDTAGQGVLFLHGIQAIRALVRAGDRWTAARTVVEVFSVTGGAWERLPETVRATFASRMDLWAQEYADPEALRPPLAQLEEILVPVLLTTGEGSPPFLRTIRDELTALLPNAVAQEVGGASHAPQLTHAAAYAGMLLSFLLERNVPSH
jgi:pimeloyl-ACP methyl ester carboxylesterase